MCNINYDMDNANAGANSLPKCKYRILQWFWGQTLTQDCLATWILTPGIIICRDW